MPVATNAVEQEIRIEASPETVFAYLVDSEKMPLWMGAQAELDPRPGGLFWMKVSDNWTARGEFVEVESPRRVVFTWGWEREGADVPPGSTTVEITLESDGDATVLRLLHRDLPETSRAPHEHGWTMYLDRLATTVAGGDPGEDPNANA
jgi:uncharacterized protein YndB with AHSA1/START domain